MVSPLARRDVPDTLLEYDQWICWREEQRDGKATKVPIDPATSEFASTTDPSTWTTFDAAHDRVTTGPDDGLGFVFTDDDPIVGVDLDDCRDPETGRPDDWAQWVIESLDSFTEVSPSGTGYHVLVSGRLPAGRNRKGDLEVYETARFFTVTADHVAGTPTEIESRTEALETIHREYLSPTDDDSSSSGHRSNTAVADSTLDDDVLLQKARNAANGEKFERLWRGDTSGYDSHSEADMALCSLLAFWTGGDAHRMDQLFHDSGLVREKWDEVHFADGSTYGEKTIERAIAGTSEFYEPGTNETQQDTPEDFTADIEHLRTREADRLERLETLEQRLNSVLEENEQLESELAAERARRQELEAQLAESDHDESLFGDLLQMFRR